MSANSPMNTTSTDVAVMLDELGLSVAALRWKELLGSPEYSDLHRNSFCVK